MPLASADGPILTFPAAGRWSCSHVAWLPDDRIGSGDLVRLAAEGVRRIEPGRLRDLGEAALSEDAVRVEPLRWSRLLEGLLLFRSISGDAPGRLPQGGRLVEVEAYGTLEASFACAWISLAAARRIAQEGRGLVLDPGWPRVLPERLNPRPVPAEPRFVLTEHVLVTSAADERGRGRMMTVGLQRLGQPEIDVANVPVETLPWLAAVVNGIAWRLQQLVLDTPIVSGERLVRVPAELEVQAAWISSSLGGALPRVHVGAGAPVRLRLRRGATGPRITLEPPVSWASSRKAWARRVVEGLDPATWWPDDRPHARSAWDG